ncbi:hypothetical protein M427DRAFT_457298 [Gonapodya prolifera JEL478]|uniref:Uncharacterized protein n=1 Tax=Gonapodya prolifera (strain JEL478) TaxID=1344416 RepID=A0A139A2F5_GONPJ|nr:hypothetical protein M427DRAFT_457298 [Gonapodya prolifera JEL478]|eukprot:KXS10931.1 hypothetical protein M427DRAFT_457298 [Gonapodya prolifera JEL478]
MAESQVRREDWDQQGHRSLPMEAFGRPRDVEGMEHLESNQSVEGPTTGSFGHASLQSARANARRALQRSSWQTYSEENQRQILNAYVDMLRRILAQDSPDEDLHHGVVTSLGFVSDDFGRIHVCQTPKNENSCLSYSDSPNHRSHKKILRSSRRWDVSHGPVSGKLNCRALYPSEYQSSWRETLLGWILSSTPTNEQRSWHFFPGGLSCCTETIGVCARSGGGRGRGER